MDSKLIINGIIIGISISAPIGPVAIMTMRKTIYNGWFAGSLLGFGAIMADLFYAFIVGFGVSVVSDFISNYRYTIGMIGSGLLFYIAFKIFNVKPLQFFRTRKISNLKVFGDVLTGFFITITNPVSFIGFFALFAGLGINIETKQSMLVFVTSIFTGMLIWWISLISVIYLLKKRIRLRNLWYINKFASAAVAIFAIIVLFSTLIRG